jgi:hypothetical protein
MSSDSFDEMERKWADETLLQYDLEKLVEFLLGNPWATWSLGVYCTEEHIPKFIEAVIVGSTSSKYDKYDEVLPLELLMTSIHALAHRYQSGQIPESLGTSLIKAIRKRTLESPE